jgi:aryl-alcohol dehydrogenase-like predicted oxidoreductase
MENRVLGRSGIKVSALGLGCWAIGGPFWRNGEPVGWGEVDDEESIRAIRRARELGVNFFDTADVYGAGHSEVVLGKAFLGERDEVVIATKFGNAFNETTRQVTGRIYTKEYIRKACEASLRRLKTDYIDLYQLHPKDVEPLDAMKVCESLEELVREGKIRYFGWSTDDPDRAKWFEKSAYYTAVQNNLNLFEDNPEMLEVCEAIDLASVNRGPLARGLLTGKFSHESQMPANDVRHKWDFKSGLQAKRILQLKDLQGILTQDGRSLTQAAIGWIWARSTRTIPIPGFKTAKQIDETIGALNFGKLSEQQMSDIQRVLEASGGHERATPDT